MLTFDEFFKKKRVDLAALEKAEPALFFEFKAHYEQMGEKSFDHTKKYWFNKTRRQFPLAPEVKTEKPQIANPIAEQTITESLTEHAPAPPSTKVGFTPKFRAVNVSKPVVEDKKEQEPDVSVPAVESAEQAAKPAGFVPRFKMKPKVEAEESIPEMPTPESSEPVAAKPAGFTPRFKVKPKVESEERTIEENVAELPASQEPAEPTAAKPAGFTPRFKMKPKVESEERTIEENVAELPASQEPAEPTAAEPAGFTPRFKMKPKVEAEENMPPAGETPPVPETSEKKPAYKPRFVPPKPKAG